MREILVIFIIFYLSGCGTMQTAPILIFSAMGDVPRGVHEDTLIQTQISIHNEKSTSEFMLHVGDIKTGSAPCDEYVYQKVAGYLKKLSIPVFIVPGDNEWNDCPDPETAWSYWMNYFADFEKNWTYDQTVHHQIGHPENMAWIAKNVLMIGINLVGGRVHDEQAWQDMMQAARDWTADQFEKSEKQICAAVVFAQANPKEKHQWFMTRFFEQVTNFKKPVLFLHGDGHRWIYEKNWQVENLTRVQVDQGGRAVPLEIRVSAASDSVFSFNRNPFSLPD